MFWILLLVLVACLHQPPAKSPRSQVASVYLEVRCEPGSQPFEALIFDANSQFEVRVPDICQDAVEPRIDVWHYQVPTDATGGQTIFVNFRLAGQDEFMAYSRLKVLEIGDWTISITATADGIVLPSEPACVYY